MRKEVNVDEKKIVYHVYGQGRPVVLLHGFGEMGAVWVNQVKALKHRYTIIVPDMPGSGESELVADMSMDGLAGIVKILLDQYYATAQDFLPIALIGHSMGGYVALAFAEKYPHLLRSLGLFHSTAYADTEEKKEIRRKGIGFMKEHGAFAFLKTATPKLFSPVTKETDPDFITDYIDTLSNFSVDALVLYYESMIARPDRSHVLKTKELMVLFVMGKYDAAVAPEDSLRLCQLPDLSYIDLLRRSGHMGMLEEGKKANEILEKFLSET